MEHNEIKKLLSNLSGLEELFQMLGGEEVEEEEILVGKASPDLIAKFKKMEQDLDDAKTKYERESEDMHKILERKKDDLQNYFEQANLEVWEACYAELGIQKDKDKHYRYKKRKGIVVEVIEKTPEAEDVIDFRKKP